MTNDQGDREQPPDTGWAEFLVDDKTRVWRGGKAATLADLAVGDLLIVNCGGERVGHPSRCTEIWAGADAGKLLPAAKR